MDRLNGGTVATSPVVFIGNLSYDSTEDDLKGLMSRAGRILTVEVMRERNGRSKGIAVIRYSSAQEAHVAIETLHDAELRGKKKRRILNNIVNNIRVCQTFNNCLQDVPY